MGNVSISEDVWVQAIMTALILTATGIIAMATTGWIVWMIMGVMVENIVWATIACLRVILAIPARAVLTVFLASVISIQPVRGTARTKTTSACLRRTEGNVCSMVPLGGDELLCVNGNLLACSTSSNVCQTKGNGYTCYCSGSGLCQWSNSGGYVEDTAAECSDGIDNDCAGGTDCADQNCIDGGFCQTCLYQTYEGPCTSNEECCNFDPQYPLGKEYCETRNSINMCIPTDSCTMDYSACCRSDQSCYDPGCIISNSVACCTYSFGGVPGGRSEGISTYG